MKNILIAWFCFGSFAPAFEVHEWGTFTVLSGSNGSQIPWYFPTDEIAQLPDFILPPTISKSGRSVVRMETPVIYFYPEKETKVSVDVSFRSGTISETFPHSYGGKIDFDPVYGSQTMAGKWTGTLHPPTDQEALAQIPAIEETENAEPYGAAREVPDAWIFESDLKEIPGLKDQPKFPQVEKFIFYRGAGDAALPFSTQMRGETVTLENNAEEALNFGTALRVRGDKAAWVTVPLVEGRPMVAAASQRRAEITFPTPDRPLDEVEAELAVEWKRALAADGLTTAEASAMVETWRKTWFRETGDRVLTLVPRKTIDAILPLSIKPAPAKIERVFVARLEMVSPEREEALVKLLSSDSEADEENLAEFENLSLGRFAHGAMEIAVQIQSWKMRNKLYNFERMRKGGETSSR